MDDFFEILLTSLRWSEPLAGEQEPSYTSRVLYPQVQKFISYKAPHYAVRADGWLRPQPVVMDGHPFYPDLAVNKGLERHLAIEVKFFSGFEERASLMTGLGQISLYSCGGYRFAALLLIGKERPFSGHDSDLLKVNSTLGPRMKISFPS